MALDEEKEGLRHLPVLEETATSDANMTDHRPRSRHPASPPDLRHRQFVSGDFWRQIPRYKEVDTSTFLDARWQMKHSLTRLDKLTDALDGLASAHFLKELAGAHRKVPMALRISPYLLALIDWRNPEADPIRRQFLPLASELEADHPMLSFDSLHEQEDAPVPGLTHRYPDKVLLLALDTCPVYCRFCTRSYAVGPDQDAIEKVSLKATSTRWDQALAYICAHPQVEDVVISGGDLWNLRADQLKHLSERLLAIPHVRRFRFASKGLAVLPQKVLTDEAWFVAVVQVLRAARERDVDVMLHTHFNHANEISDITQSAMRRLHREGLHVRNQTVLQRGVNDDADTLVLLNRRLGYLNIHPYYVYVHDMVRGTEILRTSVARACELEKAVRGTTAGFNTPTFVVDAPGGGGKRCVHSFEHYDRKHGISVYTAPAVKAGRAFLYFDPLHSLDTEAREAWSDPAMRDVMQAKALRDAGF